MGEIREPIRKSSIEKKNRIIEKGFELMCNRGYHNVTCIDIANYSNVSTGIIYQYFNDKRDIFIEGVKDYSNKIMFPMIDILDKKEVDLSNLNILLSKMIDSFINTHVMEKSAHEELMAMRHLDSEVANIFNQEEIVMTDRIVTLLENNGLIIDNIEEKAHIAMGLVDNYCHEVVYHKHSDLDYTVMENEVINTIINLLR